MTTSAVASHLVHSIQTIKSSAVAWAPALVKILLESSCCARCVLRFAGIRDKGIHTSIIHDVQSLHSFTNDPESSPTPVPPCPVCVGLLQMDYASMANEALIKSQSYRLPTQTFLMSMRLPPQLAIRNRSMYLYLHHHLQIQDVTVQLPTMIEIKEIFRNLVVDAFAKVSGYEFDANVRALFELKRFRVSFPS